MDLSQELGKAAKEFSALRRLMKHAESLELAPHERDLLMALGTALDGAHADLQKHGPAAVADLARRETELRASVEKSQQALAKAEQELQAFLAKPPEVAAPAMAAPSKPLEPKHGQRLATELLQRFAGASTDVVKPREGRAVADMASAEFTDVEKPAPAAPARPTPERPRPERPRPGPDDWRMSSGTWESDE